MIIIVITIMIIIVITIMIIIVITIMGGCTYPDVFLRDVAIARL
jgi:hypothetical protein